MKTDAYPALPKKLITLLKYLGIIAALVLIYIIFHNGVAPFQHHLYAFILKAGIFGPMFFILFQIIQVVIPILPGGLSLSLGVLAFGSTWGFIYNYLGIVMGSIISFLLIRKFGKPLIQQLVSEKNYQKIMHYLDNKQRFTRFFALAILSPVAPDDLLCMVAGLSKMKLSTFTLIIILAKPFSIFAYGYGLTFLLQHI
ncbi:TVP38/TMEM64 family protein [Enterococcus sp. AZ103]|uniref:TVP38/TMEM64 family protein n=1 Tax=Enterococcus sp. AZ103 TaxID=2774628 RepID=UPI003F2049AB